MPYQPQFSGAIGIIIGASGIIGVVVGVVMTPLSWFVVSRQKRSQDRERVTQERRQREAAFLERQISELYAPLYFMAESELRYRQRRKIVETGASKPEDARQHWEVFTRRHIIPLQNDIYALLRAKWHLILPGEIKVSFDQVLTHCIEGLSLFDMEDQGLKFSDLPSQAMPDNFAGDVKSDLEMLRRAYDELNRN